MNDLRVTLLGRPFAHTLYHFVLTYSNWEWATICFSESFESLSHGLQEALWTLGGLPQAHQTDQLSAAVYQDIDREVRERRRGAEPPSTLPSVGSGVDAARQPGLREPGSV
jgi:hypothetical protein